MKLTEHKKERLCYILEELFNYLITILVSGVNGSYIAKITDYLGFSDSLTAILSAFVTLGYSAQILAGMFFRIPAFILSHSLASSSLSSLVWAIFSILFRSILSPRAL